MKTIYWKEKMIPRRVLIQLAAVSALAVAGLARAETVNFGTLRNLTGPDDLRLSGSCVYAINVDGPARTLRGVTFTADNHNSSGSGSVNQNNSAPGTWMSDLTTGWYPGWNNQDDHGTSFSGDPDLDAIMSTGRGDGGSPRIAQLDIVSGKTYKLQILMKSGGEDRRFNLSVGMATNVSGDTALKAWQTANLAVAELREQTPRLYTYEFTATTTKLWIGAYPAASGQGFDPNPIINAITLEEVVSLTSSTGLKLTGTPGGISVSDAGGTQLMSFDQYLTDLGVTTNTTPAMSVVTFNGNPTIQMAYTINDNLTITGLFTPIGNRVRIHYDVWATNSSPNTGASSLLFHAIPGGTGKDRNHQSFWTRSAQPSGVPYEARDLHGFRFDFPSGQYALIDLPNANLNWSDPWFSNLPLYHVADTHWATDANWVLIGANTIRPTAGPALIKDRPLALDIWTTRTYNLWNNAANPLPLNTQVFNALSNSQNVTLSWWARDYNGNVVASDSTVQNVAAGAVWDQTLTFPPPACGILFVEVQATAGAYSVFRRTNLAVLPSYTYGSDRSNSIFGMNGTFGLPNVESEKNLLEQMGVRWLRDSKYSLADAESVGIGQRRHTDSSYQNGVVDNGWVDGELAEAAAKLCPYWEINNEMNFTGTSAETYVTNALVPAKARQQLNASGVGIMVGGLGGWDPGYLQGLFNAGGWLNFDALNIHPGRGNYTADFTGATWTFLGIVRNYKNALANYGSKPLYITEAYACTRTNSYWYDSYQNAADNVVLSYALAMEEGVKVMDWYQLNDTIGSDVGGVNPDDQEYHYGLLNRDLSPKPSLLAYATIARALDQASFVRRLSFDSASKNHGLMFNSPIHGNVAILWNRTDGYVLTQDVPNYAAPEPWIDPWPTKVHVSLRAGGDTVIVLDSLGQSTIVSTTNGYADIVLDGAPAIVYGLTADAEIVGGGGAGTGLRGDYYNNADFTSFALTRTDAMVNFPSWGSGSPDPSIGADTFSVRWSGQVQAKYSETYTFYTKTDDGVRLWVNDQLLIDKWVTQGGTEWSGTIALTAGQKYKIVMEYFESDGGAEATLGWSSASQLKEIIPQANLYPTIDNDTTPPTPNRATYASAPYATGMTSIAMVATTGADATGPVEYFFDETSGNPGGTDSGWQTSASYTDTGLAAGTQYTYTVTLRDSASTPNVGIASSAASATTSITEHTWRSDQNNGPGDWTNPANWNDGKIFQSGVGKTLRFCGGNDDWVNGDVNITTNVPVSLTMMHLTLQGRADGENTQVTLGSSGSTVILNDNDKGSDGNSEISLNLYNSNDGHELGYDVKMNITLKNKATIRNNGNAFTGKTVTLSGNIGEDGGSWALNKNDSSQVMLTGTNSFSGGMNLAGGTVWINTDRALGAEPGSFASENVRFRNGALMKMIGDDVVFSANRGVRFENSGTVGGDGGLIWYGVVSGAGDFNKVGGLTLSLRADNSYSGNISISQGTLEVQGNGKLQNGNYNGSVSITGDGTFRYNGNGGQIQMMNGAISGDANTQLRKEGGGSTLVFANNNSGFNGFVNIEDGTLQLGNAGTSGALNPGVAINLNSGDATLAFKRSDTLTQGTDFASTLTGNGAVVQRGSGTIILNSTNTYTGATTVEAGTLELGASGSIASSVSVALMPGAVFKTSAKASFAMPATQTYTFHVDGAGTGASGRIQAAGLNISNAHVVIAANTLDDPVYVLAQYTSLTGSAFAAVTHPLPDGYSINYTYNGNQIALMTATTTYASWASNNGIDGQPAAGDSDNDGVDNAVEMVLGGLPATQMDAALLPTLALVGNPDGVEPPGNYFEFTYRRTKISMAANVTATCQYNTDLEPAWTTAQDGVNDVVVRVDNDYAPYGAATDRVRVYVPRGTARLFARLHVTVP